MSALPRYTLSLLLLIGLMGCSESDTDLQTAPFSLGVSDAPVDSAEQVVIEIDSITLYSVPAGDESDGVDTIVIEQFTDEDGLLVDTISVDLLDFQGASQLKIIDEAQDIELEVGSYQLELNVIDAGSYVRLENDEREHAIKIPSSRLRLGDFVVSEQAIQVADEPAYTIEFDLRRSLVQRGNANNNNGYIIKPHGVKVVSLAGSISGTVSSELLNLGQCSVYVYDANVTEYGDMFDVDDETYIEPEEAVTASAPLATVTVDLQGSYEIGFVQAGSYQVALTCGTDIDDNVQFDGLTIPSAGDITPDVVAITVAVQEAVVVDF